MPIKSFVLAQTEPQKTRQCITKLPESAVSIMGRWDAMFCLQAETPRMLGDQVIDQVRKLDGIRRTETLPVLTESIRPTRSNVAVKAYVYINTQAAKTNNVFGAICSLTEAQEVYTVAGRYDVIALMGAASWEEFNERLLNRVRMIDGVLTTETAHIMA